ncbi:unnamed protein product, partial [Amoebophrya sp. A25]
MSSLPVIPGGGTTPTASPEGKCGTTKVNHEDLDYYEHPRARTTESFTFTPFHGGPGAAAHATPLTNGGGNEAATESSW